MQQTCTRRHTTIHEADDAPMTRRGESAPPAVRELEPSAAPDFDFQDMVWAFFFAASVGSGNLTGAVAVAAGFVVQKQVRRDPEVMGRATDFLLAAVPGLDVANRRLALPGLRMPKRRDYVDAEVVPDEPAAPPRPAPRPEPPVRPRWLEVVNDAPDLAPHALILGGTGVGKTTMATAIMGDRGGRTVVLSPKVSAGGWAGAEVVSLDDDGNYAPISAALADLEDEKRRRVVALRQHGPDALEPLTIVMDELVDLTSREPRAGELMVNLSSIGREIKMRLIGIGTTDKALGIKGWASSRNNYVTVQMDQQRRAQITQGERTISVNAQDTLARAQGVRLRAWRGEAPAPPAATGTTQNLVRHSAPAQSAARPAEDLLGALLAEPLSLDERIAATLARYGVPPHQDAAGTAQRSHVPTQADGNGEHGNSAQTELVVTPGGQELHVHLHARAEAHAPEAPAAKTWHRKGPAVKRARPQQDRADELHESYRAAGATGKTYRATYRELGGNRDTTLKAWQEGKAGRK